MEEKSEKLDRLLLSVAEIKQLVEELNRKIGQLDKKYQQLDEMYQQVPLVRSSQEDKDYERYQELSNQGFISNNFSKLLSDLEKIEDFIKEHQGLLAEPILKEMVAAAIFKLSQMLTETQNLCVEIESDYRKLNAKSLLNIGERLHAAQIAAEKVWEVLASLASKAAPELDKTVADSVKTTLIFMVGPEGEREIPDTAQTNPQLLAREDLAKRFFYEDESEIPPGVDPKQLDFLREAAAIGAFEWVKEYTAEMITIYFTTDITYAELAQRYGLTPQAVQERITRGMSKMRRWIYREKPELAQEDVYPLEQIKKGKDTAAIYKTVKYKEKLSQATKAGLHNKEIIKKPSAEKIRKSGADVFPAR